MANCVKRISIDTSALPLLEPFYGKIEPIVKKRIQDRCGAVCTAEDAQFTLRFVLDASIPAEGFRLDSAEDGITVSGADFLSLMYGAGQFLHKSRYTPEGIIPTAWRGQSVPDCEKRMVFFAQHFYNWYQCCSAEEITEHIEDLVLWGLNGVVSVFSILNLTGWDDPNLEKLAGLFLSTMKAARGLNLRVGIEYSNVDFMNPRTELLADKKYLISQTGNLICPSTEEGFAYYQELLSKILDYTDEFGGLDFMTIWAYDEGGCCCDKCWPWAGRGFYNMAHRISKYIRGRYPQMEIWLATWYVGRGEHQGEEWPMLYQRLQEDAAKGDNWVDYLLVETRDDFEDIKYPLEHGQPTAHTKILTFPDVSMTGVNPWGGYGAICTPKLMEQWEKPFAPYCNGGYMYTEGIHDDFNKVIVAGMYWDRSRTLEETFEDYCGYELGGLDPVKVRRMIDQIETGQSYTNRWTRKPCPLEHCEEAWALAQELNEEAAPATRTYWRWRILYIRAYLDYVRYHNCAAEGWPLVQESNGNKWKRIWRRFMENDEQAQDMLLELIHLFKAQEYDDHTKYAYHFNVRPPWSKGTDWATEEAVWNDTFGKSFD